jgi:hypothetical protein
MGGAYADGRHQADDGQGDQDVEEGLRRAHRLEQ